MSTVTNPLSGLLDGLIRGHELGQQLLRAKDEHQAFLTNQALHNQQMSIQDIMNRQMLSENARPVNAGIVSQPGESTSTASPVPGLPDEQQAAPDYVRKADRSRLVKYGGSEYELMTREEQAQRNTDLQIRGQSALATAQAESQQSILDSQRRLRGSPVPSEYASFYPPGQKLLPREIFDLRQQDFQLQKDRQGLEQGAATARKTTLEADELQRKLNLLKNADPNDGLRLIDQVVPPGIQGNGGLNMRTKALYSAAVKRGDLAGAQDAIKQAAGEVRQLEVATDPRVAANKIQVAVGTAEAKNQIVGRVPGDATRIGEEYLGTLPKGMAAQVKGIAEGRTVIPSGSRGGPALELRNAVFQYDPAFSEQRAQVRKAFTTGKQGDNIGSLNTATVHLDQLMDAAKALGNGTFKPGNAAYNAVREAFGSSAPTNFEMLKNVAAGEAANALKGNATDPEIAQIKQGISGAGSDRQLQDALSELMKTYHAKLNTYQERYGQQLPDDNIWSPFLPSAKGVFQKRGIQPLQQGNGPAPLPATLSGSDKGKLFTNKSGQQIRITEVNPANPKQFKFDVVK